MTNEKQDILFEKFRIRECLKKDAASSVYLADHIYLGKIILLKTLNREKSTDPAVLSRFQREARILAKLDHPNIIKVLDFGTFDAFFYISFEYFPSRNLRQHLQTGALDESQKLSIAVQITTGLEFAHRNGIIHRDLKPENILVDDHLQVKLADFGLAQIHDQEAATQKSSIVGTPGYMSPEQIRGEQLTAKSDLFSLGTVLYELYTGENPFMGRDVGQTINNILTGNPDSLCTKMSEIPGPVCGIVQNLLQRNKTNRPDDASAVLERLGVEASEMPWATQREEPHQQSSRLRIVIPAVVVLAAVLGSAWLLFFGRQAEQMSESSTHGAAPVQSDSLTVQQQATTDNQPEVAREPESPRQTRQSIEDAVELKTPGRLFVHCSPWADVWIDDQKVDRTPMENSLHIAAGDYELKLVNPEYPEYVKNIRIDPNESLIVEVKLDSLIGYLDCDVYPWGDVYIDSMFYDQVPLSQPIRLMPGRYTLTVKNQQYGSYNDIIQINKMDTLFYKLNFERVVTTAQQPDTNE